jgi:hypothetical protein
MSSRTRLTILIGFVVLAIVGAAGYVLARHRAEQEAIDNAPRVASRDDLDSVLAVPHIVFRSTALGDGYGQVAAVPVAEPDAARAFTAAECERVYSRSESVLCLSADRGVVTTYRAQLLDAGFTPIRDLSLTGLPSRARLSPDGSLTATTTFVFGDSYANPGQFSTRTLISRADDGTVIADLEQFTLLVDGTVNSAADRNIWGVTFVDDNSFYATAASGGVTWLVRGEVTAQTLTSIRTDVECPSLSPDGTRIAFKKHGELGPGQWRLAVYDLRTGAETLLAETRSVDDQAEWLDDEHVLYGLPRGEEGTASTDVWVVPADGTGSPAVLIPDAWSPAVLPARG